MIFDENDRVVAIVHYNTPELTRAAIGSLIVNGGIEDRLRIVVFDNSDRDPFGEAAGVTVIDNTEGQVINFNEELAKFPERDRSIGCAKGCEFGSMKHIWTVQKLWELIPNGFVLMESDVLIKTSIAHLWNPEYATVGHNQLHQPLNPFGIGRVCPMLCYMNVPLLTKNGAKYFDPTRTYGLLPGGRNNRNNWYDTGAVLFEDIVRTKPALRGKHEEIKALIEHYGSASWRKNDIEEQRKWLESQRSIFPTEDRMKEACETFFKFNSPQEVKPEGVAVCAIGRYENRYAKEWVEHYKALGVDKIFIYDNNRPEDGEVFADVLQPYIEDGLVEIVPWEGIQKYAYEDCYNKHNKEYAWIGFFDFDEFVEIQDGRTVKDLLSGFEFADVLAMNWRTMTDNGLLYYEDKPLKERFTQGTDESVAINRHVKSFVRGGIEGISFNDPHCPNAPVLKVVNVHGITIEQKPLQPQVIHEIARVDHYNTKTADEYINVKWRRGTACGDEYTERKRKDCIDYFFGINERTPEKEAILGVTRPVKESKPKTAKPKNNKLLKRQNTYCSCSTQQQPFQKPTIKEIADYCAERKNKIDPAYFFDYYEAKGWLVGKGKMKDWKAVIRNWERKDPAEAPKKESNIVAVCEKCGHTFKFKNEWECPKCHCVDLAFKDKKVG